jgi:antirestriction protein
MDTTPRIYVACLAAYNNGHLYGEWIDCNQDAELIQKEIQEMLAASPVPDAEEWAIHASENWHGITINEHEDIEKLAELSQLISEHGKAIAYYYAHFGELEDFEERYRGTYENEENFVYESLEEQGVIKAVEEAGLAEYYIDWEKITRDWFMSDYYSVEGGFEEVYVFDCH